MTRWTESLMRLFSNKPSGHRNSQTLSNSFIKYSTLGEHFDDTLYAIGKIVEAKEWVFGSESFYRSDSLKKAIRIGEEIQRLESYMEDGDGYQGVDLNKDVLKGIVTDFLANIDPVHYYAFQGGAKDLFEKVEKTPRELLPYVIDERYEKLEDDQERGKDEPTVAQALRVFEFDLLVQKWGGENQADYDRSVRAFSKSFADLILASHVELLDEKNAELYNRYDDRDQEACGSQKESLRKKRQPARDQVDEGQDLQDHYMTYEAFSNDPVQAFVDAAPQADPLLPEEEEGYENWTADDDTEEGFNPDETLLLKDIETWQKKIEKS